VRGTPEAPRAGGVGADKDEDQLGASGGRPGRYTPTLSSTRSTGTRWRSNSIVWTSMPSARPMSCGRCSTGGLNPLAGRLGPPSVGVHGELAATQPAGTDGVGCLGW
jgi:hypothetical protein